MKFLSLENQICSAFARVSPRETPLAEVGDIDGAATVIFISNGFEDRARAILDQCAEQKWQFGRVVIGRYADEKTRDDWAEFLARARALQIGTHDPIVVPDHPEGQWVATALEMLDAEGRPFERHLLDISGLSQARLFGALDEFRDRGIPPWICYTEAKNYWPLREQWQALRETADDVASRIDEQPWLFTFSHTVSFVPGHEGYDTGASGLGVLAFLPFKPARLSAILNSFDYSERLFVVGQPRKDSNQWRVEAQTQINAHLTDSGGQLVTIPTFGYREILTSVADALFGEEGLSRRKDVHLTATGSKMQAIASWVLSSLVPSIAVVLSVPSEYHQEAYSEGSGETWAFQLPNPSHFLEARQWTQISFD